MNQDRKVRIRERFAILNARYIGIVQCACRMAPFFSTARYMIGSLFSTKSIRMTWFFLDSYLKGPIFLTSCYMHIFFLDFSRLLVLLVVNELTNICLTTSNKWVQKIKGQYMKRSTFWIIKYMNGPVFSKVRYMNGVGFEILARTPVPQLSLSYRPNSTPPPPRPPTPTRLNVGQ